MLSRFSPGVKHYFAHLAKFFASVLGSLPRAGLPAAPPALGRFCRGGTILAP